MSAPMPSDIYIAAAVAAASHTPTQTLPPLISPRVSSTMLPPGAASILAEARVAVSVEAAGDDGDEERESYEAALLADADAGAESDEDDNDEVSDEEEDEENKGAELKHA